jgi:hypothetical protein
MQRADDNFRANGIYRRGSHFIWQAPLVNGHHRGRRWTTGHRPKPCAGFSRRVGGLFIGGLSPTVVSSTSPITARQAPRRFRDC